MKWRIDEYAMNSENLELSALWMSDAWLDFSRFSSIWNRIFRGPTCFILYFNFLFFPELLIKL